MFAWQSRTRGVEAVRLRRRRGGRPVGKRSTRLLLDLGGAALEVRVVPAFLGPIEAPVAANTVGVVVGDFNGDGTPDLAMANDSTSRVVVRLGQGGGTFGPDATYFQGTQVPSGLISGDFNGDGHVDLGVVGGDLSTFAPVVHLLLGNGDGTFQAPNTFPEPDTAQLGNGYGSPMAADVNGDGKLDLVATNPGLGNVEVLLGNGDGTIQAGVATAAGAGAQYVAAADFNHDGHLDLAVAGSSLNILMGQGGGAFSAPTAVAPLGTANPIAVGDLDGDLNPDLVVAGASYIGVGDGTFLPPLAFNAQPFKAPLTTFAASVNGSAPNVTSDVLADLNGDGIPDLVTATTGRASVVSVLLGAGDGTFGPATVYGDPDVANLAVADFNGDGHADLAGLSPSTSQLGILPGNGDGSFRGANLNPSGSVPNAVAGLNLSLPNNEKFVADFNNDGIPDFAVADTFANTVSISLGNADGTFQAPLTFNPQHAGTQPLPEIVSAGDFNGDGKADLIIFNPGLASTGSGGSKRGGAGGGFSVISFGTPSTWTLYLGNGDGTFTPSSVDVALTQPSNAVITNTADLNGDGTQDIIESVNNVVGLNAIDVGTLTIDLIKGGNVTSEQMFLLGGRPNSMAVTDLNGDGITDIALSAGSSNQVFVLLNNGDGTFRSVNVPNPWGPAGATAPGMVGYKAYVAPQGAAGSASGTFALKVADINLDGIPDLVVGTALGQVSILQGNGDGTFQAGKVIDAGGTAGVIGVGDFNGDGFPDIAVPLIDPFSFPKATPATTILFNDGSGETLAGTVALQVGAPANAVTGEPAPITVTAVDALGNRVPGFIGTVRFSSNDPLAKLPGYYTFTAADAGSHTFSTITFGTAGSETISANNPRLTTGSANLNVRDVTTDALTISGPAATTAGVAQSLTVTVLDPSGNRDTGFNRTVTFSSSDRQAGLPASYTFNAADAGSHTFSIILKTAGTQSITVTDAAAPTLTATDSGIVVTPAAASQFLLGSLMPLVVGGPGIPAGESEFFNLVPTDPFGNFASTYKGTATFSSTDPQAVLPPSYTFAGDGTVPRLGVSLRTAGNQTIIATDPATPGMRGNLSFAIAAAAPAAFTVSGPTATTAGVTQNVTVTVRDAFGNVVNGRHDLLGGFIGYTGTVTFSSSDVQAGLPASYTFNGTDAGVHTFPVVLKTAGAQSITVTDTSTPTITGSLAGIVVSAGPVAQFAIGAPATAVAGTSFTVKVSALDAFGSVVNDYRGKVHFSDSVSNSGLPSDYTFSSSDNGAHTFTVTLNTVAVQTLSVVDTTNKTIIGSVIINVTAKTSGGGGGGGGGSGSGGSGSGSGGSG